MMVQGDVLEVSAGTGRNVSYYNPQHATTVVMTDTSRDMLWHAAQKHEKQSPQLQAKFCLADAQNLLSEPSSGIPDQDISDIQGSQPAAQQKHQTFAPAQFDSVVDTFGLCSHADPKAALQVSAWLVPHCISWCTLVGICMHCCIKFCSCMQC